MISAKHLVFHWQIDTGHLKKLCFIMKTNTGSRDLCEKVLEMLCTINTLKADLSGPVKAGGSCLSNRIQ